MFTGKTAQDESRVLLPIFAEKTTQEQSRVLLPIFAEKTTQDQSRVLLPIFAEKTAQEQSRFLLPMFAEKTAQEQSRVLPPHPKSNAASVTTGEELVFQRPANKASLPPNKVISRGYCDQRSRPKFDPPSNPDCAKMMWLFRARTREIHRESRGPGKSPLMRICFAASSHSWRCPGQSRRPLDRGRRQVF